MSKVKMHFRDRCAPGWSSEGDAGKMRPERLILQLKPCRESRSRGRLWLPWDQEFKVSGQVKG